MVTLLRTITLLLLAIAFGIIAVEKFREARQPAAVHNADGSVD